MTPTADGKAAARAVGVFVAEAASATPSSTAAATREPGRGEMGMCVPPCRGRCGHGVVHALPEAFLHVQTRWDRGNRSTGAGVNPRRPVERASGAPDSHWMIG